MVLWSLTLFIPNLLCMDKTFDWVSDEELEGVIDGVYYKFVTETPEGESSGMIGFYGV